MSKCKSESAVLAAGGLTAILASVCCLGPLVLVMLGLGGAWVANLQVLEPYRPLFIGLAFVFLVLAYRKIWRPATACEAGKVCAAPQANRAYKMLFSAVALLVLIALGSPYAAHFFY
ncbi:MAG: mercuric ion transporter MerT [Hydrogenophilales bacterium]|nr:mercuric ion transporter MerT [Hydrogenophilales bacterium]